MSSDGNTHSDVLIIGGGVIGLACATYLTAAGRSVRLLERQRIGAGASRSNCGLVAPSHAPPLALPGMPRKALGWLLRGRLFRPDAPIHIRPRFDPALWAWLWRFARRCTPERAQASMLARSVLLESSHRLTRSLIADHRLRCDYEDHGLYTIYRTEQGRQESDAYGELLASVGLDSRAESGATLTQQDPALLPGLVGGRYFPMDSHLRPELFLAELTRVVKEQGAVIAEQQEARRFEFTATTLCAVHTENHRFTADQFVLATGAWSPRLGKQLGISLPIQPGKGYTLTSARPQICPRFPYLLKERNMAVTPWSGGYRIGGTMEFAGLDAGLREGRLAAIRRGAAEYLREPLGPGDVESWCGWRPMTADGLPFIGRSPCHENLTVAAGHNMLGTSMAAATGKLVSELICGESPHLDPTPYALERRG